MNKFETVLLLNPDLSNQAADKEITDFESTIDKSKGKIISNENWGLRDLSYKMQNYNKAYYRYYQIEIDGSNLTNIKKILTQNEKILRHLFVKVESHQELPTKMSNEEK